jgi:hypothetical protein
MNDAIPTATELLRAWDAARPRSSQAELGMSNLGGCRRAAGYRVHGYSAGDGFSMQAVLGTAIHEALAASARLALGDEAMVEDTEVRFAGVTGHPDLCKGGTLVDFKTRGFAVQLENVRRHGPPRQHLWQAMCYAAALILAGREVTTVRLDYIDRGSGEEYVWEAPFSMADVRDAMAWLRNVREAPLESLPRDYAPDSAYCRNCPFFQPCWGRAVPDRDPRSVLYLEDPDAERWLRQLAAARAAKSAAEAAEAEAVGALDAIRTIVTPGDSQDVVAGEMSARISITKGRSSLDRTAIERDYAQAGLSAPVKYGTPTVKITITSPA